ncbi:MAG: Gfo/Idh/MocA family oxidoreductase [Ignavibacteriales bacterium]|nr:Gfo/Idh/MocA family oxidoreductase [Ignavibacteriales bacterium]
MAKVRIGQVGITGHGVTILNAVRAAKSLELVSIFDTKSDEAKKVSREFGVKLASNYENLLKDPDVQAVALVTPNHLHAKQVEKAVKAGKHVFVEKPMSRTVAEARQMISRTQKAGLVLMVGHNTRRRPVFRRAKQVLKKNQLGRIVGVEMNVSRPAGLFDDVPAWKTDPKLTSLLPMTQLGIHFVDTLHYLTESATKSVSCVAANVVMEGGALDSSAAILQLVSGIPVTLSSYYVTPDVYNVRVYGTEGILECWNSSLRLELLQNGSLHRALEEDFSTEGQASFVEEMNEFGECVLTGKKPETGGEEGLMALAVIEAMTASLNTRTVVSMDNILRGS